MYLTVSKRRASEVRTCLANLHFAILKRGERTGRGAERSLLFSNIEKRAKSYETRLSRGAGKNERKKGRKGKNYAREKPERKRNGPVTLGNVSRPNCFYIGKTVRAEKHRRV